MTGAIQKLFFSWMLGVDGHTYVFTFSHTQTNMVILLQSRLCSYLLAISSDTAHEDASHVWNFLYSWRITEYTRRILLRLQIIYYEA